MGVKVDPDLFGFHSCAPLRTQPRQCNWSKRSTGSTATTTGEGICEPISGRDSGGSGSCSSKKYRCGYWELQQHRRSVGSSLGVGGVGIGSCSSIGVGGVGIGSCSSIGVGLGSVGC
ncbi:keratin-associated protein 5-10-like [Camellia sinensis]|uniref:keratin-associated protein 5-10-like n=1 Tax=Camellia sinensis TaxID=4442 RepID=UPI001036CA38|nr:keratin-associated protein 5-10-like [Camellia sinensis]